MKAVDPWFIAFSIFCLLAVVVAIGAVIWTAVTGEDEFDLPPDSRISEEPRGPWPPVGE
jgi:hypothetical protein